MADRKKITPDTVVNPDFMDIPNAEEDKADRRGRRPLQSDFADDRQESGLIADDVDNNPRRIGAPSPTDNWEGTETIPYNTGEPDGTDKSVPYGDGGGSSGDDGNEDAKFVVGKELVEIVIPFDHVDSGKKFEKFSINLKEFIIPIGEPVMVPRYVRDYWLCLNKQKHQFGIARNALEGSALPEF